MREIFPHLERYLSGAGASMGAAESHGLLCAHYCMQDEPDFQQWTGEVLGDIDTSDLSMQECQALLSSVYRLTGTMFDASLGGIALLLPDDELPLQTRGGALVDWCSGFVAGLGVNGLQAGESMESDVKEILQDLIEITHLDEQMGEAEDNEQAYTEVVEYVRVAVMTLGLALRNRDPSQTLH